MVLAMNELHDVLTWGPDVTLGWPWVATLVCAALGGFTLCAAFAVAGGVRQAEPYTFGTTAQEGMAGYRTEEAS